MIKEVKKYKDGDYSPVRNPDPKAKTEQYYLANMEYMYSTFYKGGCAIPYDKTKMFPELRLFAEGMQDESFYKRYMSAHKDQQDEFIVDATIGIVGTKKKPKGFMKLFWEVVSTAPELVNAMVGRVTSIKTDISLDPLDGVSKSIKEDAKIDLIARRDNQDFLAGLHQQLGMKMETPDFMPESNDEMEIYDALGGFKPNWTKLMEVLLKHTTDLSDFTEIETMLYKDAIALGVMGIEDVYNPETGKYEITYIDPEFAGCQYSRYPDCRDSEWAYSFTDVPITTLRQWFPDEEEEYWQGVAMEYRG
jgi:hypothetical protein